MTENKNTNFLYKQIYTIIVVDWKRPSSWWKITTFNPNAVMSICLLLWIMHGREVNQIGCGSALHSTTRGVIETNNSWISHTTCHMNSHCLVTCLTIPVYTLFLVSVSRYGQFLLYQTIIVSEKMSLRVSRPKTYSSWGDRIKQRLFSLERRMYDIQRNLNYRFDSYCISKAWFCNQ